jgi:hypothetical protein
MKRASFLCFSGSAIFAAALFVAVLPAAEPESSATSAKELANQMSAASQGNAVIHAKLEMRAADGTKQVFQLQIKERRTPTATDIVYLVQWPKERKGEAVILHQDSGGAPRGSVVVPSAAPKTLEASQMDGGLFGSDLSYQDAIENFFAWKEQAITGTEMINNVQCQILESKPAKSGVSNYSKVRSWVDSKRLVPLRIEKYSGAGQVVRRIETTYVGRDQHDRFIPARLTVRNLSKNSVTEFDGARIEQGMQFSDNDFAPEAVSK